MSEAGTRAIMVWFRGMSIQSNAMDDLVSLLMEKLTVDDNDSAMELVGEVGEYAYHKIMKIRMPVIDGRRMVVVLLNSGKPRRRFTDPPNPDDWQALLCTDTKRAAVVTFVAGVLHKHNRRKLQLYHTPNGNESFHLFSFDVSQSLEHSEKQIEKALSVVACMREPLRSSSNAPRGSYALWP